MTISKDLFLAILSMDAYNRGYGAGMSDGRGNLDQDGIDIDGLGAEGSKIGKATVVAQDISDDAQENNFYALAYELNGETIISYRGTDDFSIFSSNSDIWTGWRFGTGDTGNTQVDLARDFYEAASGPEPMVRNQRLAHVRRWQSKAFGTAGLNPVSDLRC